MSDPNQRTFCGYTARQCRDALLFLVDIEEDFEPRENSRIALSIDLLMQAITGVQGMLNTGNPMTPDEREDNDADG